MNTENYYKKIKALNIVHYTGETSYYEKAPLRSVENALLKTLKPGSRILDLGCGSGRFSVGVAEQGFWVVGMDITPAAIAAAKNKALNAGVDNGVKIALSLFAVQLILNAAWSIIFFGLHSPAWGLVDIIAMWIVIVATIIAFAKISRPAAWLLAPYIFWVSFALYLNYSIWRLN